MRAIRVERSQDDLAVTRQLDLVRLPIVVRQVTRRTSAASPGTTMISVRVSMSPSARCKVTRSVARLRATPVRRRTDRLRAPRTTGARW